MHSYHEGQIVVDITDNDYIVDRDKIRILNALKDEFRFIDWQSLGYDSYEELFIDLEELGMNSYLFSDMKKYIDSMKKILIEHYINGLQLVFRLTENGTDEKGNKFSEDMKFFNEDLIAVQSCIEYMHRPYFRENHNRPYENYSLREKILHKMYLTKKEMTDMNLRIKTMPQGLGI